MSKGGKTATAEQPAVTSFEGLVVRTESGFHRVLSGDQVIVARTPKKFISRGERTTTTAVVIGDHVRVRPIDEETAVIEEILPRRNELVRGAAGGSRFLDVIAANLDQIIPVHSLTEPDFNAARLDRFLLIGEAAEIPVVIVLNKEDLVPDAFAQEIAGIYRRIGYPVILTSAVDGRGVDLLRETLTGKISALVGPSGVGKSTLLNRVQPGLQLRTGEISESTGKGRHTTTTAELIPLNGGGFVADTPGLRELAIRDVAPEELEWLFPEFRSYLGRCKFNNCTHRQEIGCAVDQAVESGAIDPSRYASYRRVYEDLNELAHPYD
jgi:ribosome biogenesis GTPase / thiamine phosphate phosphatase